MPSDQLSRRSFAVASTAGLAALAGCSSLNPFSDPPLTLKVYAAAGDETDVKCQLAAAAVDGHPTLQRLMRRVADEPAGTKVSTGISLERGNAINDMFIEQCGEEKVAGLYRYENDWFLVSIVYDTAQAHDDHHESQGNATATEHSH